MNSWAVHEVITRTVSPGFVDCMGLQQYSVKNCNEICWLFPTRWRRGSFEKGDTVEGNPARLRHEVVVGDQPARDKRFWDRGRCPFDYLRERGEGSSSRTVELDDVGRGRGWGNSESELGNDSEMKFSDSERLPRSVCRRPERSFHSSRRAGGVLHPLQRILGTQGRRYVTPTAVSNNTSSRT